MHNLSKAYRQEIYRKLIHISSLWIPLMIYIAPWAISVSIIASLLVVDMVIEYGNFRRWKIPRYLLGIIFGKSMRNFERSRWRFAPSGAIYVLSSALICTMLFSKPIAVIALSVMLIADSIAALVGKAMGRHKINKHKSWEGTIAFALSAIIVCILAEPIYKFSYICVIACLAATIAEACEDSLEIDDNLSIPLIMGIILSLPG